MTLYRLFESGDVKGSVKNTMETLPGVLETGYKIWPFAKNLAIHQKFGLFTNNDLCVFSVNSRKLTSFYKDIQHNRMFQESLINDSCLFAAQISKIHSTTRAKSKIDFDPDQWDLKKKYG